MDLYRDFADAEITGTLFAEATAHDLFPVFRTRDSWKSLVLRW